MPILRVEYNLPDEQDDFTLANKGARYFNTLYDFSQVLRSHIKYKEHTQEEYALLEKLRGEFFEILDANGVSLEDVA